MAQMQRLMSRAAPALEVDSCRNPSVNYVLLKVMPAFLTRER